MKTILIFYTLCLSQLLFAQNLVPNPSFEDLTNCPTDFSQIPLTQNWKKTLSTGSPDIYNSCSEDIFIKVPNAGVYIDSYQPPITGNGYAGIYTYFSENIFTREYLQTHLTKKLKANRQYYLSFNVSPDITPSQLHWIYTDAVGIAFTDEAFVDEPEEIDVLSLIPALENQGTLITDTVGWTKISGCYTAKGGENFMIIGNFQSNAETIIEVSDPSFSQYSNYFYVEDVLVTPFNPLPDTLFLCDGTTTTLNASFLNGSYQWNTGSMDSTITVSESGVYAVEVLMEGCIFTDTIQVLMEDDFNDYPDYLDICADEPYILSPKLPGSYQWSDGSNQNEITVSSTGIYEATVTNNCGEFIFVTDATVKDCACNIHAPNVFSPNFDGINDQFEIFVDCDFDYQIKKMEVFDRWGSLVFTKKEADDLVWDGTFNQQALRDGVYVWFLEYETNRNGIVDKAVAKGDVLILK